MFKKKSKNKTKIRLKYRFPHVIYRKFTRKNVSRNKMYGVRNQSNLFFLILLDSGKSSGFGKSYPTHVNIENEITYLFTKYFIIFIYNVNFYS